MFLTLHTIGTRAMCSTNLIINVCNWISYILWFLKRHTDIDLILQADMNTLLTDTDLCVIQILCLYTERFDSPLCARRNLVILRPNNG